MKTFNNRNIHPFPARMAPEIAINVIKRLQPGAVILDPMVGSGTVLHHAAFNGFTTFGFDLDPLAILMAKVRTSHINLKRLDKLFDSFCLDLIKIKLTDVVLPWIDEDQETLEFIKYWFAQKQRNDLRKIAFLLSQYQKKSNLVEIDVLKIAFSRIIITKKVGASLAWDISHSRPHKVKETNNFATIQEFKNSFYIIRKVLEQNFILKSKTKIQLGDARQIKLPDNSIDQVITSPPYLNAIDYMRGHKFSLVWLGYSIDKLRHIRSISVGVEKKIAHEQSCSNVERIYKLVLPTSNLKQKQEGMIKRYIHDSINLMKEISRVLKKGKQATLVLGNSNLNNQNIENSEIFKHAASLSGLKATEEILREIPITKRYLPLPNKGENALSKRMKHEVVLTFTKTK